MPGFQDYTLKSTPSSNDVLVILDVEDTTDGPNGTTKRVTTQSIADLAVVDITTTLSHATQKTSLTDVDSLVAINQESGNALALTTVSGLKATLQTYFDSRYYGLPVINTTLVGFSATTGAVSSADTILTATEKLTGNLAAVASAAEVSANKVTAVSSASTDTQYPSAKLLYTSLNNKLDASAYVQHFKGKYTTGTALSTAYPTASDGDYAIVDPGGSVPAHEWIWDSANIVWVDTGAFSFATTDSITEGSTNLYFTNARAIAAPLTGYSIGSGTVGSSDTVLTAIEKLAGTTVSLSTTSGITEGSNQYFTNARAIAAPLTGLSTTAGTPVATDSVLAAIGKLTGTMATKLDATTYLQHFKGQYFTTAALTAAVPTPGAGDYAIVAASLSNYLYGFWLLNPNNSTLSTGTSAPILQPYCDGVILKFDWGTCEPARGTYDWSYIDTFLATLATANATRVSNGYAPAGCTITPFMGGSTGVPDPTTQSALQYFADGVTPAFLSAPNWLETAGAPFYTYHLPPVTGTAYHVPVIWNSTFLTCRNEFITALAAHLADPVACPNGNLVTGVHLIACDNKAGDFFLPTADTTTRDLLVRTYGYSTTVLINTCKGLIDFYRAAFPNILLRMAIGPIDPLYANGDTTDPAYSDNNWIGTQIANYGSTTYPGWYLPLRASLSAQTPIASQSAGTIFAALAALSPFCGLQYVYPCFTIQPAMTAMISGTSYIINSLGSLTTAQWNAIGVSGSAAPGTMFTYNGTTPAVTDGVVTDMSSFRANGNQATNPQTMSQLVHNNIYQIAVLGTGVNWTSIGVTGTPAVGTIFTYNGTAVTGTGGWIVDQVGVDEFGTYGAVATNAQMLYVSLLVALTYGAYVEIFSSDLQQSWATSVLTTMHAMFMAKKATLVQNTPPTLYVANTSNPTNPWAIAIPGSTYTTDQIPQGVTNKYYTTPQAQTDALAAPLTGFVAGTTWTGVIPTDTVFSALQKMAGNNLSLLTKNNVFSTFTASGSAVAIVVTDSVLGALQKLQGSFNTLQTQVTNLPITTSIFSTFTAGAGGQTVDTTDSIKSAIQKLAGNIINLTTSSITEGTNLFYTPARAQADTLVAPLTGFTAGTTYASVNGGDTNLGALQKLAGNVTQVMTKSNIFTSFTPSAGADSWTSTDSILNILQKAFGTIAANASAAEQVANRVTVVNGSSTGTTYPTALAVQTAIQTAIAGFMNYRGAYDASTNLFPSTGGSGTSGVPNKGDFWIASVAGTLGTTAVAIGDLIASNVNTPGQTATNWAIFEHDLGYAPENTANKSNTSADSASTTKYPTWSAITTWVAATYTTLTAGNVGTLMAGTANKAIPTTSDFIPLADAAASNVLKYFTLTNLMTFLNVNLYASSAPKTTPVLADSVALFDSANSNTRKASTLTAIQAAFTGKLSNAAISLFSALPAAANVGWYEASDMGPHGAMFYNDGTNQIPPPVVPIGNGAIPMILPCSFNMGNNGAITLGAFPTGSLSFGTGFGTANQTGVVVTGTSTVFASTDVGKGLILDNGKIATITAFTSTTSVTVTIGPVGLSTSTFGSAGANGSTWQLTYLFASGINYKGYISLQANDIYSGSAAGLYYCSFTNQYTGTIYNNTYDPNSNILPTIPASPTAFSSTGLGARTANTGTEVYMVALGTLVGGSMGNNGALVHGCAFSCSLSGGNITINRRLGATNIFTRIHTSTTVTEEVANDIWCVNRGVQTSQVSLPTNSIGDTGGQVAALNISAVDTTTNKVFKYTAQITNAVDFVVIERYNAEVRPS